MAQSLWWRIRQVLLFGALGSAHRVRGASARCFALNLDHFDCAMDGRPNGRHYLLPFRQRVWLNPVMILFIPIFILLFIVVPFFLTKWLADMIHLRGLGWRTILFMAIAVMNWQMWQAPPDSRYPPRATQAQALTRSAPVAKAE